MIQLTIVYHHLNQDMFWYQALCSFSHSVCAFKSLKDSFWEKKKVMVSNMLRGKNQPLMMLMTTMMMTNMMMLRSRTVRGQKQSGPWGQKVCWPTCQHFPINSALQCDALNTLQCSRWYALQFNVLLHCTVSKYSQWSKLLDDLSALPSQQCILLYCTVFDEM